MNWLMGSWLSLIPKLIYFVLVSLTSVLDSFQYVLRKLAGLDVYYIGNSPAENTGDIALAFIRSVFEENTPFPAIKNAFWALMILGVLLLFVTTIIGIIRQEYQPGQEEIKMKEKPLNNKIYVVTRSVKSLFLFLIVPISCLFGLMFSDILLQAADKATTSSVMTSELFQSSQITSKLKSADVNGITSYSFYDVFGGALPTNTTSISGIMFKTMAFTSNRVRNDEEYSSKTMYELITDNEVSNFGIFDVAKNSTDMADMIDDAFANNIQLNNTVNKKIILGPLNGIVNASVWGMNEGTEVNSFSKFNIPLVFTYYNLWTMNYIIGFAFLTVCGQLFVNIAVGLTKRIIEMIALFMVSPPIVAIMPLDDGKAFQKWRQTFVGRALSVYGVIVGINVIFLILPYLQEIKLFAETNTLYVLLNLIISTLFVILGIVSLESFIALVSKMIGADDAQKAGSGMVMEVGKNIKKSAMLLGAAAGVAAGAAGLAFKGAGMAAKGAGMLADKASKGKFSKAINGAKTKITNAKNAVGNAVGGMIDKPFSFGLDKKAAAEKNKAENDWARGGADKAFNDKMSDDKDYQKEMDDSYATYQKHNGKQSKEDWLKDKSGKKAMATAEANYSKRLGQDRNTFKNDEKNRDNYVNKRVSDMRKSVISERKARVLNSALSSSGLQNTATFAEVFTDEMKDSFTRGDAKGGFSAMRMAFRGGMFADADAASIKKKFQKEERMRAQVQVDIQKELEEKNKKK